MKTLFATTLLVALLGATAADAHPWGWHHHHHMNCWWHHHHRHCSW